MSASITRRICFIVPVHTTHIMGGAQYQVKLIIDELLKDSGVEIHYITERVGEINGLPYQVHVLRGQAGPLRSQVFNRRRLLTLLEQLKPDIMYQRLAGGYTGICAEFSKRSGVPLVFHIAHEFDVDLPNYHRRGPLGFLENRFQRYGIKQADHVIAQTRNQERLLERYFNRNAEMVIYNAHPLPNEDHTLWRDGTRRRILWVGIMRPMKQPDLFIDLAGQYKERDDLSFVMIGKMLGKPAYKSQLESRMADLPNLEYRGEITQDEVNRELLTADLIVNTSKQEGFSNTFIQAWMRGVQVLSLNSDPDHLLSNNSILGMCCHGDLESMHAHFNTLIGGETQVEMQQELRAFAAKNFTLMNMKKLIHILKGTTR